MVDYPYQIDISPYANMKKCQLENNADCKRIPELFIIY